MIEVVIPAYNAGRFLRETLESVAAQTLLPELVTVVDDRSADDTVAVANACAEEFSGRMRIRIIPNTGPRGPSSGRNTAIRQSRADWIALLDADDLIVPTHHELLLQAATAASDVVLGFGDSCIFRDDGPGARTVLLDSFFSISGVSGLRAEELAIGLLTLNNQAFPAMLKHGLFGTSACLFRRDKAIAAGLFDEKMMYVEDTDFFLRLALIGRFGFTPCVTTFKRVHDENLSQQRNALAFCHGNAFSFSKLVAEPNCAPMIAEYRASLDHALTRAVESYLYQASRFGFAAYGRAMRLAWEAGRLGIAAAPRHLARLALYSMIGLRSRDRSDP